MTERRSHQTENALLIGFFSKRTDENTEAALRQIIQADQESGSIGG